MRLYEISRREFLAGAAAGTFAAISAWHMPYEAHERKRNPHTFTQKSQEVIFGIVAHLMDIEIDESIPRPRVIPISTVPEGYVSRLFGVPVDTRTQWVNIYDPKRNIIILGDNAKLHNLAHEYVHFFQVKYQKRSSRYDFGDSLEAEAIKIQHVIKNRLL